MNETDYHRLADAMLNRLSDALENADQDGRLEVDAHDGSLAIDSPAGKQWLVSKHTANRQLWLASPVSGGLHFSWDAGVEAWRLPDGRALEPVLWAELKQQAGLDVA